MVSLLDADLIVCTRNRPGELTRVLHSIAEQATLPETVLVVDSSDADASADVVEGLRASWPSGSNLALQRSGPGLPHQRNVGVDATGRPIVCFLDDDVVLEPDYFVAIGAAFAEDHDGRIGGVGATIVDQPPRPRLWRLDAMIGLDSHRQGAVLRSGRNVRVYSPRAEPLDVEWLAGLATAYRREVLAAHRPNEALIVEGEDVEFSYRVVQDWRLVVLPHARVHHVESATNRPDRVEVAARELWVRHLRCRQRVGRVRLRWFWYGVAAQLSRATVTGLVSGEQRSIARGTVRGALRIVRKRGFG